MSPFLERSGLFSGEMVFFFFLKGLRGLVDERGRQAAHLPPLPLSSLRGRLLEIPPPVPHSTHPLTPLPEALAKIFDREGGKSWDYVFNCGGETRYSQEDEVYKLRSLALSVAVGNEAARRGARAFVELSTGMVYKPDSSPSKEGDKLKPWSKIAVFKLQAEEELAKIEG
jgi:hypothetical protein